jgi:ABC-type multidrug transport system fused ATPase/permease subunit
MTHRVLRAPLSFFETTPLGRVLNRFFTYDVEVLDVELSVSITGLMVSFSWLMSSIVVIIAVLPWIMFGVIPVTSVYCLIQFYYRMSGPDLQRIDAVSRSPLQASLAESKFCSVRRENDAHTVHSLKNSRTLLHLFLTLLSCLTCHLRFGRYNFNTRLSKRKEICYAVSTACRPQYWGNVEFPGGTAMAGSPH